MLFAPSLGGASTTTTPEGECTAQGDDAERLLCGLKSAEPWARRHIFETHERRVRGVVINLLGPGDPAVADIVQNVFLRAFEGVGRLRQAPALQAWLCRIAVNCVREHLRRKRVMSWFTLSPCLDDHAHPSLSTEERDAVTGVYEVLAGFPEKLRTPFALHFFAGMDLAEIADAIDISYSTAQRRLSEGRSRFRRVARRHDALKDWL
jgi:RNA polymerase sigma-70 factor (ECF subfamily)